MDIKEIERKAAEYYAIAHDIDRDILTKDLDVIATVSPTHDNIENILHCMDFKMWFLESLPDLLEKYVRGKTEDLSEMINTIRKRYDVEKILSETGGVYIASDEMDVSSSHSGWHGYSVSYDINSLKLNPNPTTYQKVGTITSIKEPDNSFSIHGRTINEFEILLNVFLGSSASSLFLDIAGGVARLQSRGHDLILNDGWTNVNLERGSYDILITPRLTGTSFNVIVRQLIFTNDVQIPEKWTYTYDTTHVGYGIGIIAIGGKNTVIDYNGEKGKEKLFIGDISQDCDKYENNIVDPTLDLPVSIDIDRDARRIGYTEIEYGRGLLVSTDISEGFFHMPPLGYWIRPGGMFYVDDKLIVPPTPHNAFELHKLNGDSYQTLYSYSNGINSVDMSKYNTLLKGWYMISMPDICCIGSDESAKEEYMSYVRSLTNTSILLPVEIINRAIYADVSVGLLKFITSRILLHDLWVQMRDTISVSGSITIESEKPIDGFILVKT